MTDNHKGIYGRGGQYGNQYRSSAPGNGEQGHDSYTVGKEGTYLTADGLPVCHAWRQRQRADVLQDREGVGRRAVKPCSDSSVTHEGGESMDRKKLFDLMAVKGLTQAELAEKAGVSRASVWAMVKKGRSSRPDTVGKVARVLGVKPSELLDM